MRLRIANPRLLAASALALFLITGLVLSLFVKTHTGQAAFPGANGKIAFTSNRDGDAEVYVMNTDGTGQINLTNHPAWDGGGVWSPDGAKMAFGSNRDGTWKIYMMNADGTCVTQLTIHPAMDGTPTWSPDGTKIAFWSNRDGNGEIYVMNADGTGQTNLTNHPANDDQPAWSPDGTKIAFMSYRDGNHEVYVMNADGTGQTNRTNHPAGDSNPDWSPDGTKIAFATGRDDVNGEVYVMNADGTGQTNLTNYTVGSPWWANSDGGPQWSPDGAKIAFGTNRNMNGEVYVMNADGSGQTNLTNHPAEDGVSDWQPIVNQPPVLGQANDVAVSEGVTATSTGTVNDPDGDPVTLTASAGTVTNNGDGTWSWSLATQDGPADSQTVTITADDGNGGSAQTLFALTVNNVSPVVDAVTAPGSPVLLGTGINVSAAFHDDGILDTHAAVIDWDDSTASAATVSESGGSGTASASHLYAAAGVYTVKVTVTDNDGGSAEAIYEYVVVYDPSAGFVTGGGWINSPAGAYSANPALTGKATFGFVSRYQKGASVPTGQTEFQFKAGSLNFHSSSYDWLVVAGPKAQYKGSGTINGGGSYGFMLMATDGQLSGGGGIDKFRIKIWDKTTGLTVYDNMMGADDADSPTTVLGGGSIVIHK